MSFYASYVYRYKNPGVQWEQERDDSSYIPGLVTEPVESNNSIPGLVGSSSSSSVNPSSKKKNKKKQKAAAGDDVSAASATAARIGALALNDDGADFQLPDDVRAALGGGAANDSRPKASHSQSEPSSKPGGHPKRKAKHKGAQSSSAAADSK